MSASQKPPLTGDEPQRGDQVARPPALQTRKDIEIVQIRGMTE